MAHNIFKFSTPPILIFTYVTDLSNQNQPKKIWTTFSGDMENSGVGAKNLQQFAATSHKTETNQSSHVRNI